MSLLGYRGREGCGEGRGGDRPLGAGARRCGTLARGGAGLRPWGEKEALRMGTRGPAVPSGSGGALRKEGGISGLPVTPTAPFSSLYPSP